VFGKYLTPPLPPVEDEGLDGMLLSLRHCADELAKAAVRERDQWKGKYERVQAENDALRAQLERVKSVLGM
jgi:hypothetical protein